MSAFDENSPRQLVPRWRTWRTTVWLGECLSWQRLKQDSHEFTPESLISAYFEKPNVGRASELFTSALIHDLHQEQISSVANQFVNDSRPLVRHLAEAALMDVDERSRGLVDTGPTQPRERIAYLKLSLVRYPRNPFHWTDIAREYIVLAQPKQAIRAMHVALSIAPSNRFVLRSAAALFVHTDDLDQAIHYLQGSPTLTADPWILAPYIAVSELADRKHLHHRETMRLLENSDVRLRDRAELAAAMGTLEAQVGNGRRGRQLLRLSAESPTDNSLAQVEWMSVKLNNRLIEESLPVIPHDFEAQARRSAYEGHWRDALNSSVQWLHDQPFTSSAATFGSFCASMVEDWTSSVQMAQFGLSANPNDPGLLNNEALAHVELGEIEVAIEILLKCRKMNLSGRDRAVLNATEGLLLFRAGMTDDGRRRYKSTISYFEKLRDDSSASHAALRLAFEEKLSNSEQVSTSWQFAAKLIGENWTSDLVALKGRIASIELRRQAQYLPRPIPLPQFSKPLLDSDDDEQEFAHSLSL